MAALEAGPKKKRAATREELRWAIMDAREEMEQLKQKRKALAKELDKYPIDTLEIKLPSSREEEAKSAIAHLEKEIDAVKCQVAEAERDGAGLRVNIDSLDSMLLQGLQLIDEASRRNPLMHRAGPKHTEAIRQLNAEVRAADAELLKRSRARLDLDQRLSEAERQLAESQRSHERSLRELLQERERNGHGERTAAVATQETVLKEKQKQRAHGENKVKLQEQLEEIESAYTSAHLKEQNKLEYFRSELEKQVEAAVQQLTEELATEESKLQKESDEAVKELKHSDDRARAMIRYEQQELDAALAEALAQKRQLDAQQSAVRVKDTAFSELKQTIGRRHEEAEEERSLMFKRFDLDHEVEQLNGKVRKAETEDEEGCKRLPNELNEFERAFAEKNPYWRRGGAEAHTSEIEEARVSRLSEEVAAARIATASARVRAKGAENRSESDPVQLDRTLDTLAGSVSTDPLETEASDDLILDFRFPVDASTAAEDDAQAAQAADYVIELEEDCLELEREKSLLVRKIEAAASLLKAARSNTSSRCPFCGARAAVKG
jgi:uncharacterized protein YlxW (UPF0749 family)